jgi:hypothetical protein
MVAFDPEHYHFNHDYEGKVFGLSVIPITESEKYPLDTRIEATIMFLCNQLLANNDIILIYTCESIDNKEQLRFRKFTYWFNKYNTEHLKKDLILSIENANMFASVIYHKKHPSIKNLETEIDSIFGEYSSYK